MSVYHTVHSSSGPFVYAFPCYFYQCPRAKLSYSCILGHGRPVPSSLQLLHCNFFTVSFSFSTTSHIFHALPRGLIWLKLKLLLFTTRSLLTSSATFGSFTWNCMSTTTLISQRPNQSPQPSTPSVSALPSTSATVAPSSSSTVTSSSSNVSVASRSWKFSGKGSSNPSSQLRKRFTFASWHYFFCFGSFTIHRPAVDSSHLFVYSFFVVSKLLFHSLPFLFVDS